MVEQTELLEDFGVVWIFYEDAFVCFFCQGELVVSDEQGERELAHIFLLLMYVTDLEPNVDLCQRPRRIVEDISEAFQGLLKFVLLLVDHA